VLPPSELGARLDRILTHGVTLVAGLPGRALDETPLQIEGSVRDLAFRLFRRSLAYVDGMDMGELRGAWLREPVPPDLVDGPAVARYGALVRGRVAGWFEGAGIREFARTISTESGTDNGHALLERTVAQAAQCLRQLHAVSRPSSGKTINLLSLPDFEGLPLPASPWEERRSP